MYCRNCGSKMPDDYFLCANCGEPLAPEDDFDRGRTKSSDNTPETSWESTYEPTWERRGSETAPDQNEDKRGRVPGAAKKIVGLVLAAALLVAVGVGIAILRDRRKESEPSFSEEPAQDSWETETNTGDGSVAVVQVIDPTPAVSVEPYRAEPTTAPVWIEASTPAPFYGIWCTGSKDQGVAEKNRARFAEAGLDARVFVTTDWSNLNSEKFYVVTAGTYSSYSEAEAMLPTVKNVVKDAYIKYSGDWKGATNPDVPFGASAFTGWLGSYSQRSFAGAYASSEFVEGNIRFIASYAIDDGINRPWVEGVSGSGIGETLTLYFQSDTTVSVIDLTLGYARDSKRYYGNNRPSLLRFSFSDGSSFDCAFQDVMADQAILLSRPASTTYIEITILDVYYGTDNDTCIYLVKAYG